MAEPASDATPKAPSPEFSKAEEESYGNDMHDSYGQAYATRSTDEGFGQIYGDAVKKYKTKPSETDTGESEHNNQPAASAVSTQGVTDDFTGEKGRPHYDTSQGHPVAEKEHGRHSTRQSACEAAKAAHERAEDMGSRGGLAT